MAIGFDNPRYNQDLVLDPHFIEGTGSATLDWAKPHHVISLATPVTWTALANDLMTLLFNPVTPDRLVILAAASTDLNFTSGAFSGAMWIYPHAYGNRYVMMKGAAGTGWSFWIVSSSPYLAFTTEQAGPAYQTSQGGAGLALNAWQLIGFTRSGASGRLYLNGVDTTTIAATHINPASSAASDFYMGTTVGGGAGFYDGGMWRPRIWDRAISAAEMAAIYEGERDLPGV